MTIKYCKGYKYQLAENYTIMTSIMENIEHEYYELSLTGRLVVRNGYAWDGASGPTIDTKSSIAPSLVHDVFCQMMRTEILSYNKWQNKVNEFFREHLKACGMGAIRAWYWYKAVEMANAGQPTGEAPYQILEAP